MLLKVNQIGSVTEAIQACKLAQENGWGVMVSRMFNLSSSPSSSSLGRSPAMWLLPSERLSTLSEQLEASSSFLVLSA
ncbi:hypothetical protein ACP3WA_26475, partial [Salmonella enterica]|uniref:hypothetical protein n=1 Tax=Salmonella enterica TaxID=28901 RepID=UPI003CF64E9D